MTYLQRQKRRVGDGGTLSCSLLRPERGFSHMTGGDREGLYPYLLTVRLAESFPGRLA
jgi:hypothetical protein